MNEATKRAKDKIRNEGGGGSNYCVVHPTFTLAQVSPINKPRNGCPYCLAIWRRGCAKQEKE